MMGRWRALQEEKQEVHRTGKQQIAAPHHHALQGEHRKYKALPDAYKA
jgi:hypothetical protein